MLIIFTSIAKLIISSGFDSAIVQKKDISNLEISSIFFYNLFIGILLTIFLWLFAPLISNFYNQPILISLSRVLSLNFIAEAFGVVQRTLLIKNLDFKSQTKISVFSNIVSGLIGIVMAFRGFGVWSLVARTVSNNIINSICLWINSKWFPIIKFKFSLLKSIYLFSSRLLIAELIATLLKNIYQTIIGKVFTPIELGYYSKAQSMADNTQLITSASFGKVMFPAMATLQNNIVSLKNGYQKTIRVASFLHFPIMIGLIVVAEPLVKLLLTDKWIASVPYFQILCFIGLFHPFLSIILNVFKAKGRSDLILKTEVYKIIIVSLTVIITYRWSIIALLFGQFFSTSVMCLFYCHLLNRITGYDLQSQLIDILPCFFRSIIMGMVMYFFGKLFVTNLFLQITFQSLIGVFFYYLLNKITKSWELEQVISIALNIFNDILSKLDEHISFR
jgi:O-antigen/teichoic acid export membrane protein